VPVFTNESTAISETIRNGYTVSRYRPRGEGLFARIERWSSISGPSDVHWRSISPDNTTTLYGQDEASRISDPADQTRVFQWLISGSYDCWGNAILYEYKSENSESIPAQANERDADRAANRYLKRILYGNSLPASPTAPRTGKPIAWLFEVVFDYGEHNLENPEPDDSGEWGRRLDPFSSYRSTFELRTHRLCKRVLMFHLFPDELGEPATLVRSALFAYDESPNLSFMKSVTQSGHMRPGPVDPPNSPPYLTQSFPPLEFEYTTAPTVRRQAYVM